MNSKTIKISTNQDILNLLDETGNFILIHKFNPSPGLHWYKADLNIEDQLIFKNAKVRSLEFDLQTDLEGFKEILNMNTNQLRVYQFDRKVPDTLDIENLSNDNKEIILKKNGLLRFLWIDHEFVTVESPDKEVIASLEKH